MADVISFVWNETRDLTDATGGSVVHARTLIARLARRATEATPPLALAGGDAVPPAFDGRAEIEAALAAPLDPTGLPARVAICRAVEDAANSGQWTAAEGFLWVMKGTATAHVLTKDDGSWGLFGTDGPADGPVFASEITGTELGGPSAPAPVVAAAVMAGPNGALPQQEGPPPVPAPTPKPNLGRALFFAGVAAFAGSLLWANSTGSRLWSGFETFTDAPVPLSEFRQAVTDAATPGALAAATRIYAASAASFTARATLDPACDAGVEGLCEPQAMTTGTVTAQNADAASKDMAALAARAADLRKVTAFCLTLPNAADPKDEAKLTLDAGNEFTVTTGDCGKLLRAAGPQRDGKPGPAGITLLWQALLAAVGLILLFLGAALGITGTAKVLIVNGENRYSLSRAQALAWTLMILPPFLVLGAFNSALGGEVTAYLRDFAGDAPSMYTEGSLPYVETALWAAMGIALASAGLSPLLNAMRPPGMADTGLDTDKAREATLDADGNVFRNPNEVRNVPGEARISDFVTGDTEATKDKPDVARIQLVFITIGILIVYGTGMYSLIAGLPAETVLTAMARGERAFPTLPVLGAGMAFALLLSHAAYLSAKPFS